MNKLDDILYESLVEDNVPSEMLNRQIIKKAGMEEKTMKKSKKNMVAAAAVTLCVAVAGGSTAYAAYRYLTSSEIAGQISENQKLIKAFDSKDAISINKVQKSGDYSFNLLGIVTGSDLEPYVTGNSKDKIDEKKTYITMSISKSDGSKMPDRNFCVSPLIGGVPFMVANNGTLGTELIWFEQDGVVYELVSCDNLEMFADRGVWLSVVDSFGDEARAYTLNEDGSYTKNNSYEDFSALFKIPFDESKADKAAADKYLESIQDKNDAEVDESEADNTEVDEFINNLANMSYDEIAKNFEEIKEHTITAKPNKDGMLDFTYEDDGDVSGTRINKDEVSGDKDFIIDGVLEDENGIYRFSTIYRNEDGSFTYKEYKTK